MEAASLELKNLVKLYKDVLGVGPVSLSAGQGEFIALLGPSGCGKTTTLRCIAGLETPTEGEVMMDGELINDRQLHKREIGFVFQDYALFPHMTVAQNVGFGLRFRKVKKDKKEVQSRIMNTLELVNLQGLEDRYPSQLSGGQQQRVALARAIVIRPKILLLDEPLSNIDAALRQRMQIELKNLQQKIGITAIHVTHDQQEAFTLADKVALFNKGQLVQFGPPDEVYESPIDPFVAEFIGDTNFLEGVIRSREGRFLLETEFDLALELDPKILNDGEQTGRQVLMTIRPQRIKVEAVDLLEGKNIIQGFIEQKINMGDLYRFLIRLGGQNVSSEVAGTRGIVMIVNKYNTRESRQLPSKGVVRVQLHPEDIRPVNTQ
ncbi:Putrescine transport ATP-binding protein PotA (TC 3.A.1.11.1) [Olavius sp. associated proteobacterium Delta 1]|nr:Putrescine transport ATP-binding protein PotA (TC 3.A.1.11.1) [Olavius sp. associated proteobacterium Delta 1]